MAKRTIVFGDVHGCCDEWRDLLDLLSVTNDDDLISVGDLIHRGPASRETLELARSLPNLRCVLGNHELRFLKLWRSNEPPKSDHVRRTVEELGERFDEIMRYVATWPFYLDLDDPHLLVVHAGVRPGISLDEQSEHDLTHIRTVDDDGTAWYEEYTGDKLVVFGHWAMGGLVIRDNVIGLDTGCVYGGRLSACVLPGREIVSVPARRQYVDPLADR